MNLKNLNPFRKSKPAPNVNTTIQGSTFLTKYTFDTSNNERNIRNGYEGNSLIAGAISFWQMTFSQAKFKLESSREGSYSEVLNLLQNPNPEQSESDFKLSIITNVLCGGETFILAGRNKKDYGGKVVQLWNYHAGLMQPWYTDEGFLGGYRYYNPYKPGSERLYPIEDVIHLKWISRGALNANKGLSPIAQVFNEVNLDSELSRSVYSYLKNDLLRAKVMTMADGYEIPSGEAKNELKQAMIEQSSGKNKGMPIFMEGIDRIQEISGNFSDLNPEVLAGEAEARIASAFKISPILLEWCVGLRRTSENNVKEADKRFNTRALAPLLDIFADTITHGFKNRFGFEGDYKIIFDRSDMESFRQIQMEREDHYLTVYEKGGITFGEWREEVGLPPAEEVTITSRLRNAQLAMDLAERVVKNYNIYLATPALGMNREQCVAMLITGGFDQQTAEKLLSNVKPQISETTVDANGNTVPALTESITARENL